MKKYRILLFAPVLLFLAFSKAPKPAFSKSILEKNLVLIPAQRLDTSRFYYSDERPEPAKTDSFYLYNSEISNAFYRYYLSQLKDTAAYRKALPDTLVWRDKFAYNEPYVDYYFRHPAYDNYPVVGVSWEQANAFCEWLTKTYNAMPDRKFKNVRFDLPTKTEWWSAANGGKLLSAYSWGGPNLTNAKGESLANFKKINQSSVQRDTINGQVYYTGNPGGDYMGTAGYLNDAADITAPVNSYFANGFGLYNMNGNVEEMVREKGISKGGSWRDTGYYLQNAVEEKYNGVSSERGFRIAMYPVK